MKRPGGRGRVLGNGRRRGSLSVVGVGITGLTQATLEAVGFIEQAERLFYLVLDPLTEHWLRSLNPNATTLADLYGRDKPRRRTYHEMAARIAGAAIEGHRVCAVFYGHPGVLVQASREAVTAVRRSGLPARIIPGISAEACLYADLDLDPGASGVQSFEATDFLLYRRRIDPSSALILWQIGVLGDTTTRDSEEPLPAARLRELVRRLTRAYPLTHRAAIYEAATFPGATPRIVWLPIRRLADARIRPLATLYVPARPNRAPDPRIVRWLGA